MTHIPLAPILEHYGVTGFNPDRMGWSKVLCPVHDERRPSCSIRLDVNYFDCKSCGAKGHAIDLVMMKEGLGFEAAAEVATRIAGSGDGYVPRGAQERGWRTGPRVPGGTGYRPRLAGGWRTR